MTAPHILDPASLLGEALSEASPDLMRHLLQTMINTLLCADADAVVGAEWGKPSSSRTAQRNGYRYRDLDTRVGTVDVAIPKLRSGTYFPDWLLERRKRAESALITVVADCYLAGVSTRRMDKLVKTLGINALSKSQVSRMAAELDEQVESFRHRPLDEAGPFTFVAADALTMKVREGGRVVNAVVLLATGVNGDGHREVLGLRVATSETGAAWNEFFADLVARGLAGVRLVTSDAHTGLKDAIAANLPGAVWQRCRTHYGSEPDGHHPEVHVAGREGHAPFGLRPARRQGGGRPVRPIAGLREREAAGGGRAPRRRAGGHPGVHHVPEARVDPDLVEQPGRAAQLRRSAGALTRWVSSRTGRRSSGWWVRCWPSRPTNGLQGRRYLGLEVLARCRLTTVSDTGGEVNTDTELTLGLSA